MNISKSIKFSYCAAAVLAGIPLAQGAILQVDTTYANGAYGSLPVSGTDLINFGQSTLLSHNVSANSFADETPDQGAIDGTATGDFTSFTWFTNTTDPSTSLAVSPGVFTFNLDVSVNTLGYSISQIDSYAGFSGAAQEQADQILTISYSLIGDAGFTTLGTYTYLAPGVRELSRINLTDDTATYMLTGVDALQFSYADPSNNWNSIAVQEIDVLGVATAIPEASTTGIFVLSLIHI